MILFIAALQRIPDHLYEAAWTDGASPGWQTFRHITWPQLRGATVAVVTLNLINAFQAFDEFYNILGDSRGYPPFARPPLVYLYYTSLGSGGQDLGRGSAGAVILTLIIAAVTLVQGRVFRFGRGAA
jgi:multiple sugar transport system permease protein